MADQREAKQVSPMLWWGTIQSSVRERATTAELWRAIRETATRHGVAYPPGMFREVNRLRSLATVLRESSARLSKAGPETALTADHVGLAPYARDAVTRALDPRWHVRVQLEVDRLGVVSREWLTLEVPGTLPSTVGQLRELASTIATPIVEGYNAAVLGLGAIEVAEW